MVFYMAQAPMFRINQLSKDLGMKPKEMQSLLAEAGIGEKNSSATLEADEFNLLLDTLTKKRQIKNLDLYLNGQDLYPLARKGRGSFPPRGKAPRRSGSRRKS